MSEKSKHFLQHAENNTAYLKTQLCGSVMSLLCLMSLPKRINNLMSSDLNPKEFNSVSQISWINIYCS